MKISCLIIISLVFTCYISCSQAVDFNFTTASGLFCSPQSVIFTQNSTGNPVSFFWNFGNGISGKNPTELVSYRLPGNYSVTLTAIYDAITISTTKTVTIGTYPAILLTADKISLCQPGVVNFSVSGNTTIATYEWDYGDGSPIETTTSNTSSHNFGTYDSFKVSVKAITSSGCIGTSSIALKIAKLTITGNVNPFYGCTPANSLLNITTLFPAGDGLQNVVWNFGDGSPVITGNSNTINHIYNTTIPILTATASVTSRQGCTNQFVFPPFAFGIPPVGTQSYTVAKRDTFCGSEKIQFIAKANNANSYFWNFGDGTTAFSLDTIITHKFVSLGNKQVTVTPYFNGCEGPSSSLNIFIKGVIANFSYVNNCATKINYSFTNLSLGNISHFEWAFADVSPLKDSINYNPKHVFPSIGSFVTSLLVKDKLTGCSDSVSTAIVTASPSFISNKNSVCKDSLISYKVINGYPAGSGRTYEFHITDTIISNSSSDSVSIKPDSLGTYNDYVVIKDTLRSTCNDTLYLAGGIKVKGPIPDFVIPRGLCADSGLIIKNTSFPFFASDPIIKWTWDFGDNQKDFNKDPSPHKFPYSGPFAISLTVTDVNGCSKSVSDQIIINPLPIVTIFPPVDTLCGNNSVILKAFTIDSLLWITNTNISCITCDTVFAYPTVTTNYIARAKNIYGCTRYDSALIKVYNSFKITASPLDITVCPGLPIQLNVNAVGNILWSPATFLNKNNIPNPISIPDSNIIYKVLVRDSVGCFSDSAFVTVKVYNKPFVNAGNDTILPIRTQFILKPVYSANIVNYLWIPAGTLSCTNCPSPNGIAFQKQTYQIQITDVNGCKAKDSMTIFTTCEKSNLLLPNAFTPNRDGLNDYFYPIARGFSLIKNFVIFNRFGTKVFERKDFQPNIPSLGWNGVFKGDTDLSTQTFVWIVEGICDAGETITTRGSVNLVK